MNIKLLRSLKNAASDTYKLKMGIFESINQEEILKILIDFNKAVSKTGTSRLVRFPPPADSTIWVITTVV